MTDNEIIKALECCISPDCGNCPYDGDDLLRPCNHNLMIDALSLINRQKAKIERMQKHNKKFGFCNLLGNVLVYSKNLKDYNDMRKGLKSEAVKEFAERLKRFLLFDKKRERNIAVITEKEINNLVKEMTEGNHEAL